MATTSCCSQEICYACIKTMVLCKEDRAKELATTWLGKAHQCPQCSYGPVEHFACGDLSESQMNKCPQCQFQASRIGSWPAWNGTLPQSMQVMEGRFDCPYCRKDSAMSSAFGEETIFCTKCTKMGHLAKDCKYVECRKCHKPGHMAKDCKTARPGPGYKCKHCGMPSGMLGCHWSENCLKRTK